MPAANRKVRVARPRRRLRSEVSRVFAVLALPLALAAAFPYGALSFRPAPAAAPAASCAFVTLSTETESRILSEARAAWHTRVGAPGARRLDLFAEPLPVEEGRELADVATRTRVPMSAAADFDPPLLPPSRAAAELPRPPADPSAGTTLPAFPKEELLRLE